MRENKSSPHARRCHSRPRRPLLLDTLGLLLLLLLLESVATAPPAPGHPMLQSASMYNLTQRYFHESRPYLSALALLTLHPPALVITPVMIRVMPRSPGEELKVSSQEALAILRDIAAATGASAAGGGDDGSMGSAAAAAAAAGGVLGGGVAGSQARESACRLFVAAATVLSSRLCGWGWHPL